MITNEEIKNFKKIIEEQNVLIEKILRSNSVYLDKLDSILNSTPEITPLCKEETLEGDYISFYSNLIESIVVGRIISNEDDNYQIYYPLLNKCDCCCYNSIEELIEDFEDYEDFMIIHTGSYSNMIPNKTSSYMLYEKYGDEVVLYNLFLSESDGIYLYNKDTGDVFAKKDTYDEVIFSVMKNYELVIPLR